MATYLVTPDHSATPPGRFTATDLFDLGEQVVGYLTRRHLLIRGTYEAQIGNDRGAIHQDGRVVAFTITQES